MALILQKQNTTAISNLTIHDNTGFPQYFASYDIYVRVTNPALLGVLLVTLSWNDGVANRSVTYPALSLLSTGYLSVSTAAWAGPGSLVTISTAFVGVTGSPEYDVLVQYLGNDYFLY